MSVLPSIVRRAGVCLVVGLLIGFVCLYAGARTAAAATPAWSPVTPPWGAQWAINDVYAFGATGLAAAGEGGHVAVSRDGGASWKVVVPAGSEATSFTAIALGTSGGGVVASGGRLLVTSDGGSTWTAPVYTGAAPTAAIEDVAVRGSQALAVADDGTIFRSSDAGATWENVVSPTLNALTSVAIADGGTAICGSASGEILVESAGVWALAGTATAPVTAVSTSDAPVWGDGRPDLFAAAGGDVLGSDDGITFASLPGLPDLSASPWPALTWAGVPEGALLVAGGPNAGFFETVGQSWLAASSGLAGAVRAVAPGDQSVGYLLGNDGRLVRTLSAGRDPATTAISPARIVVGGRTTVTLTVRVGAPGVLLLRGRVPGGAWSTERQVSWTPGDWNRRLSFTLNPSLTHEYRLEFKYGGALTQVADSARVVVVPKITTPRSRLALRVGDVFRFSGFVTPKLSGGRVELFTDRGGGWRPVSLQPSVALRDGGTWKSRAFGTPKAETYRLRAHLPGTAAHAEAWSRTVTVTIHW